MAVPVSVLGDVFSGLRQVLALQDRVDRLSTDVQALDKAHDDTRERLIRIEAIIDEARRSRDARRLPGG